MSTTIIGRERRVPFDVIYDFIDSPHIRVIVGNGEQTKHFVFHEALITRVSSFFVKAKTGHWKESEQRTVSLPEDDPEIFSLYLKFLYTGALPVKSVTDDDDDIRHQYICLSKLYVLSEKLLDDTTKSTVLDALSSCAQETNYATLPDHESVCTLYGGSAEFSPVRVWLIYIYTMHGRPNSLGSMTSSYPGEFLADLAVNILSERVNPTWAVYV